MSFIMNFIDYDYSWDYIVCLMMTHVHYISR